MPRKPEGERALTAAERQARQRERKAELAETWRRALEQIQHARTVREAREIAAEALS
jgi:hypothetical protein